MTDTKQQPTEPQEPKCPEHHVLLVEGCPYCVEVRAFREQCVLNAAVKFMEVGRRFGNISPSWGALYSAVERLESPAADPAPPTFKKTSDASGIEYRGKGGKKA